MTKPKNKRTENKAGEAEAFFQLRISLPSRNPVCRRENTNLSAASITCSE